MNWFGNNHLITQVLLFSHHWVYFPGMHVIPATFSGTALNIHTSMHRRLWSACNVLTQYPHVSSISMGKRYLRSEYKIPCANICEHAPCPAPTPLPPSPNIFVNPLLSLANKAFIPMHWFKAWAFERDISRFQKDPSVDGGAEAQSTCLKDIIRNPFVNK